MLPFVIEFPHRQLVISNRQALRLQVTQALDAGHTSLIVSMPHCEGLDASGMGVLCGLARRAREFGGRLVIVGLISHDLDTLWELTHLTTVLERFPTLDAALAAPYP